MQRISDALRNNTMAKRMVIGCLIGMSLLTGCANMNIVGTGSTESSSEIATVASTLDSSATEEKSRILAEAKKLGITGECYESYTSKEDEPDQSAVNHGADYYVIIYGTDGDAYYGAVVDGQVKIWSADEKYDTSGVDASRYEGNAVIKLDVPDKFQSDVTLTLWCYGTDTDSDITPVTVPLTKDQDYTAGVTVPAGDCTLFDYAISGDDADSFYVEKDTFTASDTQSVVVFQLQKVTGTGDVQDAAEDAGTAETEE